MKGNKKLVTVLNSLLVNELTAINQDMVHSELCANWGYNNLHMVIRKRAMDEMQHAGWLIERIINLNSMPALTGINRIKLGKTVPEMISNDNLSEIENVQAYN